MPPVEGSTATSSAVSGEQGYQQLPWTAIPKFIPGTTDVTEYTKKLEFLAAMWPKEHLSQLAPRAALLCEGSAFKKVAGLAPDKLKANDVSGVKLLVDTLGGLWGRTAVEQKYDTFERAIFGTIQKADETNDSYLARHDIHFEELLAQGVSFEEVRAYILLRQSSLTAEDRKRIVVELDGQLSYKKVCASVRLLGSRFFSDFGQRGSIKTKTYDAHMVEDAGSEEVERAYQASTTVSSEEPDFELDAEFIEAMIAVGGPRCFAGPVLRGGAGRLLSGDARASGGLGVVPGGEISPACQAQSPRVLKGATATEDCQEPLPSVRGTWTLEGRMS